MNPNDAPQSVHRDIESRLQKRVKESEDRLRELDKKIQQSHDELNSSEARLLAIEYRFHELDAKYESAGADVGARAQSDLSSISVARAEAERLLLVIRGASLFGRYSADANDQRRQANIWRLLAAVVPLALVVAYISIVLASRSPRLPTGVMLCLAAPALVLFFYFSLESYNHRRREADRRRIALRMAAIESYLTQRMSTDETKAAANKLMDDFIRQHFIEPNLDSNELSYLGPGPKFSLVNILPRYTSAATTKEV